jgi:nitroreductase
MEYGRSSSGVANGSSQGVLQMQTERMTAWFEATASRHSRRVYTAAPVDSETLDTLASACEGFHPYPDARVTLVTEPGTDIFTGVIGSYGKVTGAPHVLCVIVDEDAPFAQQHAGYVGEAAVLEATSLGLGTCWIGGFFDPEKAARLVRLGENERVVAVSPVGIAVDDYSGSERAMRTMSSAHKRKSLERIVPEGTAGWPDWALAAVECARIAPSAVNRQPWRFRMRNRDLLISRDSPIEMPRVTKALDCGIAMLHIQLGALSKGVMGRWEDLAEGPTMARFVPLGEPE